MKLPVDISTQWTYQAPSTKTLNFAYDGAGIRVKKDMVTGSKHNASWYVRDAQGNILAFNSQYS